MISLAPHADIYRGLLGGALIGASSSMLLMMMGKISGMSGIVAQALRSKDTNGDAWHSFVDKSITSLCYIAGLLAAGYAMRNKRPEVFGDGGSMEPYSLNMLGIATAAILVGFGTRMGNGCTVPPFTPSGVNLTPVSPLYIACLTNLSPSLPFIRYQRARCVWPPEEVETLSGCGDDIYGHWYGLYVHHACLWSHYMAIKYPTCLIPSRD